MTCKCTLILLVGVLSLLKPTNSETNVTYRDKNFISDKFESTDQTNYGITVARTPYEQFVDDVLARGITKLGVEINKAYRKSERSENVLFAPLNIAEALALILLGSNGKTFQELASVLGLATGLEIEKRSVNIHEHLGRMILEIQATAGIELGEQISIAGAIFVQNNFPIRSLYQETAQTIYNSEVVNVDFQNDLLKTQQLINAWVYDRTNGKIENILADSPPPSTKVIIASVMHFKARWENPFPDYLTNRLPFYPNGEKSTSDIQVDLMGNIGTFPYLLDKNLGCEVLGLPYKGNSTVMYIVKPLNSNVQKLRELEDRLESSDLESLAANTALTDNVGVLFPKMKLESTINLKRMLMILGVNSLFDPFESNLGLLSPGETTTLTRSKNLNLELNPIGPISKNPNDTLIFSRSGNVLNCSDIDSPKSNLKKCKKVVSSPNEKQEVKLRKLSLGKVRNVVISKTNHHKTIRVRHTMETIDSIRNLINQQSTDNNYQNPGLYADEVIHKVYMETTESGTEAAAATVLPMYRTSTLAFRANVPFMFFIRHEQTKTILFWGSVYNPTSN